MSYKYKLKEIKVGDTKVQGGVKYTVNDVDPETGAISWKVDYVANITRTFKEFKELRNYIKKLSAVTDDDEIDKISKEAIALFNRYRTHIRNNYQKEYAKISMTEEEIDEMSTSAGAGSYLTKYAFKLPKKQKEIVPENIGATLGPGPKAGPDGVKDNYYVKKFKYKLIPKNKNGNYVQKSSGLEVKNF